MELITAIALGISLSACAGIRAIVPLFLLSLGHYLFPDTVVLSESVAWLGSLPAVLALAVATLGETLADKVPAVDNVMDVLQTPVRTLAGAFVFTIPFADWPVWVLAIVAIIGGANALTVHSAKTTIRAASTVTTGGLANPVISFIEDGIAWVVVILALLLKVLMGALVLCAVVFLGLKVRKLMGTAIGHDKDASAVA